MPGHAKAPGNDKADALAHSTRLSTPHQPVFHLLIINPNLRLSSLPAGRLSGQVLHTVQLSISSLSVPFHQNSLWEMALTRLPYPPHALISHVIFRSTPMLPLLYSFSPTHVFLPRFTVSRTSDIPHFFLPRSANLFDNMESQSFSSDNLFSSSDAPKPSPLISFC